MSFERAIGAAKANEVEVFLGKKKCCQQSQNLQLCPLGLQFYSPRKLEDLTLLEFNLTIPGKGRAKKPETVTCTGAVVRCQREKETDDQYRVWIKFLDLPERARERIKCVSRDGKYLCSYCENY